MRLFVALACVALVLVTTPLASADVSTTKPLAVYAMLDGAAVSIGWVPGPIAPDYYIVYGLASNGSKTQLATEPPGTTTSTVASGYAGYAVSAVKNGTESEAARAITPSAAWPLPYCYSIILTVPPDVAIGGCSDAPVQGRVADVLRPVSTLYLS